MNFNNELFFNEVPGYDSSKGEPGILKALHKLRIKISSLEQVRISEKNIPSKDVQAGKESDVSVADVQVELLRTQLYFLIKKAKEYPKSQSNVSQKNVLQNRSQSMSSLDLVKTKSNAETSNEDASSSTTDLIDKNFVTELSTLRNKNVPEASNACTKSYPSTSYEVSNIHPRINSQPHYHMKLDDVPFILGASSSASHSLVANVQNIIAMMKMHNRALCASKHKFRENVGPKSSKKSGSQDANEMIQELTEDLSKLTMKQEKLKQMFDDAQEADQCKEAKDDVDNNCSKKGLRRAVSAHHTEGSSATPKLPKEVTSMRQSESSKNEEKHLIFSDKIKTNNLFRRKMLRSLQDFKVHLSEEDIQWK